jgi:hypothetical protein
VLRFLGRRVVFCLFGVGGCERCVALVVTFTVVCSAGVLARTSAGCWRLLEEARGFVPCRGFRLFLGCRCCRCGMDCVGAVAGGPSVPFFGGALLASVLWLPRAFRFLFFLAGLAEFGVSMGAGGSNLGGSELGGSDLGLAGSGGKMTRGAWRLASGARSCRLLVRCLKRVFSLACSVPKYCRCQPVIAPTILAGSASSLVIMSLTDVVAEKISRLTRSACEALMHLDLVIVVANRSRWINVMWFARGCSSLWMATARFQQAGEGAGKNLFPMKTWRCSARFAVEPAASRVDESPSSGCRVAGVVLRAGVGRLAPVLASKSAAVINPCPWLAVGVMTDAVWFGACAGVSGRDWRSSSSRVRLKSAGAGQALTLVKA